MRLEIKDISADIDLKTFVPSKSGYSICIDVEIGFYGQRGADDFRFTLADSKGVLNILKDERDEYLTLNNYNLVILEKYSYDKLTTTIKNILSDIDCNGNWSYVASQINKLFYWEYEKEELSKLK